MSSTRTAKDDSVYHQSRYASAPEFERGLMANLVAKRCALLADKADIELIWFLQYLSHQDGGMEAVAKDLIKKFPARLMTREISAAGLKPGKICNADQVREIRRGIMFERGAVHDFLLKGEIVNEAGRPVLAPVGDDWDDTAGALDSLPTSYPVSAFIELCHMAARSCLENNLRNLCLDPGCDLSTGGPWYFPDLVATLREAKDAFIKAKGDGVVTTALGEKVCEVLDYTAYSRGLTLMEGNARLGKSFSARTWCLQRPGQARYVEVPTGNDEASFFRALARGLGLGNFLKYKVSDIRERVESVLLCGDLLLVLDEAQRLWPQTNMRYGYPSRITWLMAMANHDVPICCIATPQFIELQKMAADKGKWNSAQLTGRIKHYETLPTSLSEADLQAVAKSVLPEADATVLAVLAAYATSSDRYLAAIDSIATRARYLASLAGRQTVTTADVRAAMKQSVMPADTRLQAALADGRKPRRQASQAPVQVLTAPVDTAPVIESGGRLPGGQIQEFTARRETRPADLAGGRRQTGFEVPLVGAEK